MSERKVLNKYYPADYDPSKIPKGKRNRNATFNIRIMAPFNMRCNMCKEYIYKGKKFNSRKEDVMDETYLGLRIFRFYIKCPRCVSEIAFKTDLENTDYTLEAGAKRLFEAEKIAQQMAEEERKAKEEDEMNPMKMLENRTKASRAEMDQIDSLEELREMNTRKNLVNTDAMIEKYRKYEELLAQLQMEQEEEEIKEIFGEKGMKIVKRLDDSDDEEEPPKKKSLVTASTSSKPTDILAEDSKQTTTAKESESWQKSVGSLSSTQKLKGLVVKKKSSLPAMATKTSAPVDQKSNTTNSNVTASAINKEIDTDIVETKLEKAENDSFSIDAAESKNEEKISSETSHIVSPVIDIENGDITTVKLAHSGKNMSTVTESGNAAGGSKLSGLGMLGAYSDSESDSSG